MHMTAKFFKILSVCLFVLLAIAPTLNAFISTFYLSENYDDNWALVALIFNLMALPFTATSIIAMIIGIMTYEKFPTLSKVFNSISILASIVGLLFIIVYFK